MELCTLLFRGFTLALTIAVSIAPFESSLAQGRVQIDVNPLSLGGPGTLLFSEISGESSRILRLDLGSGELAEIQFGKRWMRMPALSPDRSKLAFSAADGDLPFNLFLLDLTTGVASKVPLDGSRSQEHPSWSPDGRVIFFTYGGAKREDGDSKIAAWDLNTEKLSILVDQPGRNSVPKVSPDGATLIFSTDRKWPGWDICLFDLKSKRERCILGGPITKCRANWDPSGRFIIFSEGLGKNIALSRYYLSRDSSEFIYRGSGPSYDVAISPNGEDLIFSSDPDLDGEYDIFRRKPDSSVTLLLDSPKSLRDTDWR